MFAREPESLCGFEVCGDSDFRRRTREALALLQPLPEFELISVHLRGIRQGRRSGVEAWRERPVFTVGAATWNHSPLWYASVIAHDAYHAKLYGDAKRQDPEKEPGLTRWTGQAAETVCLDFQRRVLVALNAGKAIIDHVEKHAENPSYQGRSTGWGGWLDYRKRWW